MHTNALLIAGMVFGDVKVYRAVESVRAGQVEILSESTLQRQPSVCERTKEGGKRAQIQTHACTHARLHIRRRSRQQQHSLPSVTGQCLSEHNTHTAPWQQALPASCSHCVMRQSEEINLAAMLQSRAETKTCIKCMDVF